MNKVNSFQSGDRFLFNNPWNSSFHEMSGTVLWKHFVQTGIASDPMLDPYYDVIFDNGTIWYAVEAINMLHADFTSEQTAHTLMLNYIQGSKSDFELIFFNMRGISRVKIRKETLYKAKELCMEQAQTRPALLVTEEGVCFV
jgi:hypothetical protein